MIRTHHNPSLHRQRGVVIMIMLLILIMGSAYFLLTKLNKGDPQQPRNTAMTAELGAITTALIGYALTHKHCLPCPDTNSDGLADGTCGSGAPVVGTLPWVTLNIGALDAWEHRIRYAVDPDFTDPGTGSCTITASQTGDITVQFRDNSGIASPVTNDSPALVLTFGTNGYGGISESGTSMPNPPASHFDEITNSTTNASFIQREASADPAVAFGPYDDLLAWVPLATFRAQLVNASGALPPP